MIPEHGMSTEQMWIIGGLMAGLFAMFFAVLGASITIYASLVQRITKIETTLDLIGISAAKLLHSPHTPELDELLEKYVSQTYDLTMPEWKRLVVLAKRAEDDSTESRDY